MDPGHAWVLADLSGHYELKEWAKIAIAAYLAHVGDQTVAEVNDGGEMVEAILRVIDPNLAFAPARASRGKVAPLVNDRYSATTDQNAAADVVVLSASKESVRDAVG
jgi:phage terminase large subunit-like protein